MSFIAKLRLGALALPALLFPAACGWGSAVGWPGDPAPAGFAEHRGDGYRVAYPAGWTVRPGTGRSGRDRVEINGPATPEGAFSGQVRIARWTGFPYAFEDRLAEHRRRAARTGRPPVRDEPLMLDGAVRAHRFVQVAPVKTPTGAAVRMRTAETLALTGDRVLLEFSVTAPDGRGADVRFAEILASFALR